jgi:hypothetical protein
MVAIAVLVLIKAPWWVWGLWAVEFVWGAMTVELG